jgi:hypothetical protein
LFFWRWANQIGSSQKKKNGGWNCEAPPTKKNKYTWDIHHQTPQEMYVIFINIKINAMHKKNFLWYLVGTWWHLGKHNAGNGAYCFENIPTEFYTV